MIPLGTDIPQRRTPWMNYFLIAVCFAVYFASHHAPTRLDPNLLNAGWNRYMLNPGNLHWYQFITYQFLHANIGHILGNMLFLWVFGNPLNEKIGHPSYLCWFLAGGVLAGCGQVLTSNAPTLGASGSIAAVAGMFLALLPLTNIRVWFFVVLFDVPSFWFVGFQILFYDVAGEWFGASDNVAHFAHLTGYTTGFITGMLLLAAGLLPRDHYDMLALIKRWQRRREYRQMVARGYNPFESAGAAPVTLMPGAGAANISADESPNSQLADLRTQIAELRKTHRLADAAQRFRQLLLLDPAQVLPAETQLDMANQFMSEGDYALAATSYERYLQRYSGQGQIEQVQLILALIYARHQINPTRAVQLLHACLERLHDPHQKELAQNELNEVLAKHPEAATPPQA